MIVTVKGEHLRLMAEKVLMWEEARLIVVADLHLGKAASLQARGVPVPEVVVMDLQKIARVIERERPARVLFLGDWIHATDAWSPVLEDALQVFFASYPQVRFELVIGNHERGSLPRLARLPLRPYFENLQEGPFLFEHGHEKAPPSLQGLFVLRGHWHPVVEMRHGSTHLRLPCFWQTAGSLTLPSFGELTGGHPVRPGSGDRIYAVAGTEVVELPRKRVLPFHDQR